MARKGGKGRKRTNRGWLSALLLLPLLLLGSLVLFEGLFERPLQKRFSKITETKSPPTARLAIIIDDGGYRLDYLQEVMRLGKPLTYAILPGAPHTRQAALLVHRKGGEVMLHLPMEPKEENSLPLEKNTVKSGMAPADIQKILREGLSQVPHARGVNAHMGSKATEDPRVMEAVMEVLKEEGLYYVDSHTTPHSAGMKTAQAKGVRAGQNGNFLDAVRKTENISEAIRTAMAGAKKQGRAIAIGHPDPLTLRALKALVPEIERAGIKLVFASEIVG